MASSVRSVLQRQVGRVSRRLFFQLLLDSLIWCWVGALALSAVWFLVQLYALRAPIDGSSWAVAGGLVGAGALLAVVLAFVRAPSRLAAALSLDEKFGLKERVTTSLTLAPDMEQTSAGQALLADVSERVTGLQVGSRFPVRVRWSAVLVPAGVTLLVLAGLLLEPFKGTSVADAANNPLVTPEQKAELQQKLEKLAKKPTEQKPEDPEKSKELQKIEAELEKIVNKPHDTKDAVRERSKEITDLENDIKQRQKDLADKASSLKEQLKNIDRMGNSGQKDGAAKELEKALKEGDFKKAEEIIDQLAKKLENEELKPEEKEKLAKQMDGLRDQLQRLAEQKDEEKRLEELKKKGQLSDEAFKKAMDDLKKKKDELKDLDEMADKLSECKQCMGKGDSKNAGKSLKKAGDKLRKLESEGKETEDLEQKLQALNECKQCMGSAMGQMSSKFPGTKRPETKDAPYKSRSQQQRVEFDPSGQKEIQDFVPGKSFKKKTSSEIAGEVQQASQEAPEAVERQRVPQASKEMTKGFYEALRKQSEKDQAPEK
jgi:uncharacterized coiled-coil DUF342 family protein